MKKIYCLTALFVAIMFAGMGCSEKNDEFTGWNNGKVASISVPEAVLSGGVMKILMREGEPLQLTPVIFPESATNKTLSYSNLHQDILTVSESGVITPLKFGTDTVIVSATDGSNVKMAYPVIVTEVLFTYKGFIGNYTLKYGGTTWDGSTVPTYSDLDVTISQDVENESYIIKGLLLPASESQYTIKLRYSQNNGLIFDAQKLGMSGTEEVWAAMAFWSGTGTYVRAVPSYCSLKSTNIVKSTVAGNSYGTGYSFKFTDNSNAAYPSQPGYIAYGISFRTFTSTTGTSNGTAFNIGACSDGYRCYNISLIKK
jgi:hypothetical protein